MPLPLECSSTSWILVDTGASYSILPHHSSLPPFGLPLTGLSVKRIPCWGGWQIHFLFHGYSFVFLLSDVQFSIIKVDFYAATTCKWTLWRTAL